jgi:hypothetical protein
VKRATSSSNSNSNLLEEAFADARDFLKTWAPMLRSDLVTVDAADADLRNDARLHIAMLPDRVLPKHLRIFVCDLLSEYKVLSRKRGNKLTAWRNLLVTHAVRRMINYGFKPTRNPGHRHRRESGSSIVAKVLRENGVRLTERRVGDIWVQFKNRASHELATFEIPAAAVRDEIPWEALDQVAAAAAVRDK